jgi:iron complex transport system substrate-binding protein
MAHRIARCSWAFVRRSDRLALLLAGALAGAPAAASEAGLPRPDLPRVVSMNVCTDQLAMLLAAPGQLLSVSMLAADPLSSSMADRAAEYPANYGQAEQVFLMHPDVVLAGSYGAQASVQLLRDLGMTVVQLPPVAALAEVTVQLRTVGKAMGREAEAEALAAQFEADLAALRLDSADPVSAAMYYPNGYITGAGTLADDILRATGFANVGAEAGVTGGGILPLERLVMAAPRMIVTSTAYPGASRSEEILAHPALVAVRKGAGQARVTDADWICGTPHILRAVAGMAAARRALEAGE